MSTQKTRIAVDLDDVIGGFNQAFIPFMNDRIGTEVIYEDCHTFDMKEIYGISTPDILSHLEDFCHRHHDTIEPIDGAPEGLAALKEHFDLTLVTSRCESLHDISREWLEAYDLLQYFDELRFANGASLKYLGQKRSKSSICHEIEASILIDDAAHNAIEAADAGIEVLLMNRPWNESLRPTPDGIYRVTGWPEIVSRLTSRFQPLEV